MNRLTSFLLAALAISASSAASAQTYSVLVSFSGSGGAYLGGDPLGSLTVSGSTLYGMTELGGTSRLGNVFTVHTDGSGFQNLVSFSGSTGAYLGACPDGDLTLVGSSLYGMTASDGGNGQGYIFRINTNGSGFQNLFTFSGGNGSFSPWWASDGLTPIGSTLYGMTPFGGASGQGNLFRISTSGSGYQNMLSFSGTAGAFLGADPYGNLTLGGSTFYGMSYYGGVPGNDGTVFGVDGLGTIFKVNADGSGFQNLLSFTGTTGAYLGQHPAASLTLSGSTLYGMTVTGGAYSDPYGYSFGTVFRINTDGTGFQSLYSFSAGVDGYDPEGSLTLVGSTLYGMTSEGGAYGNGTVFRINTDGSDYRILFSLTGAGGSYPGEYPCGGLTLKGATLYGMTCAGGASDNGVVFAITLPTATGTWTHRGGGSWNSAGNWDIYPPPGTSLPDTAIFGNVIGSTTATVTLDGSWTIGSLSFSTTGGGSYTISRSAADTSSILTLIGAGTAANASLTNSGGNHIIAVPVVLGSSLNVSTTAGSSLTIAGPISQASPGASVALTGSGKLILSASNTYTGGTIVSGGTLQLGDGTANNGSVAGNITNNATVTFANLNAQTYTGAISGSGGVTKTAAGALVLSASNIYSGGTEVDAGVLVVANGTNGSATGNGAVTLNGGTLASATSGGSIEGTVQAGSGASTIAPGGVGPIGQLTIGSLITSSNLTLNFDLTRPTPSGGSGDLLTITIDLSVGPHTPITFGTNPMTDGDYRLIAIPGDFDTSMLSNFDLRNVPSGRTYSLSTTVEPGYIDLVVPEPSTLVLLGVATAGLLGWALRRKQA